MKPKTYDEVLETVAKQVEAGSTFEMGYAFGKLMGQSIKHLSDEQRKEFQDGFGVGVVYEACCPDSLH